MVRQNSDEWSVRFSNTFFTFSKLFLVVWMTASCGEQTGPDARRGQELEGSTRPIDAYMTSHFDQVTRVQRALVRGDLDEAHVLSRWLSQQPTVERLPEAWKLFVEEMKTAARLTGEARTYRAAAAATSAMVKTCGECHRAVGVKPQITELGMKGLPPADQLDRVPRMLRHQWAVARMWVGLINPSEAAWKKGVAVLTDAPLEPQIMTGDAELVEEVGALARAVHEVGKKALQADDWDGRALLYGELLATCAGCHRELGLSMGTE